MNEPLAKPVETHKTASRGQAVIRHPSSVLRAATCFLKSGLTASSQHFLPVEPNPDRGCGPTRTGPPLQTFPTDPADWPLARPAGLEHLIAYGQSLAAGFEGWPALSTAQRFDSLMLGDCVGSNHPHAPFWHPLGRGLNPLIATVQRLEGPLMSAAEVAALAPGTIALGETVLEAATTFWRARLVEDPGFRRGAWRLLASTCAVGGRSLEALSKDAEPELFNRLRDCAAAARDAASAAGLEYGIAALLMLQGEQNSFGLDGSTGDRDTYKTLLARFHDDFAAEIGRDIAGQAAAPPMFLYQTGGDFVTDSQAIPQAQLDLALERPNVFMAAPVYPVTSKHGHLDANGYRWLGSQFGKVLHRVLTLGLDWKPLHPIRTTLVGRVLFVDFHVPVPPLAWGRPYRGHAAIEVAERGFSLVDAAGPLPIAGVELDGPAAIRIRLARDARSGLRLCYADLPHHGRGSLHDSDATRAEDIYEYHPGTGQDPSANIAELVGRPYPLMNWCAAFDIAVTPPLA